MQLFGILFFALTIPISALLAERGRRPVMIGVTVLIALFGLVLAPLFVAGTTGVVLMMVLGLSLMGLTYGPLGTVVSELFPTSVRYTGSSLTFSLAGILRRVARAVYRHVARQELWPAVRWLLSDGVRGGYSLRFAFGSRDKGRGSRDFDRAVR